MLSNNILPNGNGTTIFYYEYSHPDMWIRQSKVNEPPSKDGRRGWRGKNAPLLTALRTPYSVDMSSLTQSNQVMRRYLSKIIVVMVLFDGELRCRNMRVAL
jgi:hypothetical protein